MDPNRAQDNVPNKDGEENDQHMEYIGNEDVGDLIEPTEDDMAVDDGEDDGDMANDPEVQGMVEEINKIIEEDDSSQGYFDHTDSVYGISVHPTLTLAASGGGDDRAFVWDYTTGETFYELSKHDDTVAVVKFSVDGEYVATGGMDGKIYVYDVKNRKQCAVLEGPDEVIWMDWHPKGHVILAGANDGTLWMWNAATGDFMNSFHGHSGPVTCGRFTHNGRNIVSGSEDGSLIVWDPKTASSVAHLTSVDGRFHQGQITSLDISSDDTIIVSGSADNTVVLSSIKGEIINKIEAAEDAVEAVGFCDTLPLIAFGSVDGVVTIWDKNVNQLRKQFKHDDAITKLYWFKDSPLLLSTSVDGTARVWDGRSGDCLKKFRGHRDAILEIAMSSDSKTLVTASDDKCCLVFRLE